MKSDTPKWIPSPCAVVSQKIAAVSSTTTLQVFLTSRHLYSFQCYCLNCNLLGTIVFIYISNAKVSTSGCQELRSLGHSYLGLAWVKSAIVKLSQVQPLTVHSLMSRKSTLQLLIFLFEFMFFQCFDLFPLPFYIEVKFSFSPVHLLPL